MELNRSISLKSVGAIAFSLFALGCNQGDERLAEKARIEGKETAEAELEAQLAAQEQLIEQARNEGKAAAEAELQAQIENIDQLTEKARAEGRAGAQAEFQVQMDNLDALLEKAKNEGKAVAQAELQVQMENLALLEQKARAEGKAAAQAELQAQLENMDILVQRARAEGRAAAEAELGVNNGNLASKAHEMEADLATRHLFYQALKGTYEGELGTERGQFKVRITLVPSLPPNTYDRVRQLDEISSDLNNLYFHAQVLQWNPANSLSSVGCRVENIRPDTHRGEIAIASSNCPNLYKIRIVDPDIAVAARTEENPSPKESDISIATAKAIRNGTISELAAIRGEVHPTTNASIYTFSATRTLAR